jgi:hypothetical protein
MNNTTGGGTTLATIKVDRGSTFVSSVVISSGSISPTITFANLSKTFGNAPFTLSPTSDSPGAFTFTSSNTSVATISGSTVTIVANGISTITATQASSGNYSSATATATLTVGAEGTVSAPTFSTAAGAIAFPTTITLSSTTTGATIHYTTDGSTPTTLSPKGTSGTSVASVVVNSAQTIKAFAIKTGSTDSSISSAAYTKIPTYETDRLIINYDATSFSNNGIWTNSGTGGAAYNGVVTGSIPVVNSPSTTNNPTALSISNQTNSRTNYIDTGYSTNDGEWTIEIIAKAPSGGSGNSIIRKEKAAGQNEGEYWIGVQGSAYYFRNQASRGADGSFHVLTFTSDGKIFVDNIERQGITGSNVNPSGNILIVTDLSSEGGHTWQLSRFKYYNKILSPTERTLNQNQKGELGF